MKVNVGICRVSLERVLKVLEAEQGILVRIGTLLDMKGSSLDECVRSANVEMF